MGETEDSSTWRALLVPAIAGALIAGLSFNVYYSETTVSRSEVKELVAQEAAADDLRISHLEARVDIIAERQTDVRIRLATLEAQVARLNGTVNHHINQDNRRFRR